MHQPELIKKRLETYEIEMVLKIGKDTDKTSTLNKLQLRITEPERSLLINTKIMISERPFSWRH